MAEAFLRIQIWFSETQRARAERGASLVEYALLLALIAMVCFVAVQYVGTESSSMYEGTGNSLANAN